MDIIKTPIPLHVYFEITLDQHFAPYNFVPPLPIHPGVIDIHVSFLNPLSQKHQNEKQLGSVDHLLNL